jgi:hypothetical protein
MLKFYYDNGGGVTRKSLEYWKQEKHRIGAVLKVEAAFEPLEKVPATYNGDGAFNSVIHYTKDYNVQITGTDGVIMLSGCNSGYGGEGPNGTRAILEELGISHEEAVSLMTQKHFTREVK